MLERFGGCLQSGNLRSTFAHPVCSYLQIAGQFDACLMMKLARNVLDEYQIINISGKRKAKWVHIKTVHVKQAEKELQHWQTS